MITSISFDRTWPKRAFLLVGALICLAAINAPPVKADTIAPVRGEFTAVFEGVDSETGALIFEGFKTGELSGDLSIRAVLTRQTGRALHFSTSWTLATPWGETVSGENTALLSTASLHFREHGMIVDATGSLTELIGNFFVSHGEFSDLSFIPGVMRVDGTATYVPSQGFRGQGQFGQ